jgi:hypothetical protein
MVLQQGHRPLGLPGQFVHDLAVRADQRQLAEGLLVLHVARLVCRSSGRRAGNW